MEIVISIGVSVVVLIFSAILHEVAHGYVADRLGDPTARLMGRLTLNPIKHIDPFLSIALPLILIVSGSPIIFGGAKPVPVDPFNLKEGRKDLALVSLAGPMTNVCLAIIAAILLKGAGFLGSTAVMDFIIFFLTTVVHYNILLAIFNLLPIPPLDGSKIFSLILPDREAAAFLSLGQIGMFILFILLAFPIGGFSLEGVIGNLYYLGLKLLGV
jgi:Zn-dependent protease